MTNSKAQIVATIGPTSNNLDVLRDMISHNLDVVRMNFSWGDLDTRVEEIKLIRELEKESSRKISILIDLPGPRLQEVHTHTYEKGLGSAITERDREFIKFAVAHQVEYVAVSFVGGPQDIVDCKKIIKDLAGKQKVIAKIERAVALDSLESIINEADAVMIARGDLGNEVPLEKIPFVQDKIIKMCKKFNKPVIVATQMLISMVENTTPTRAEVTDVANAILQGADAVMLSEETTIGKHPVLAVEMMEKIIIEAEQHLGASVQFNLL